MKSFWKNIHFGKMVVWCGLNWKIIHFSKASIMTSVHFSFHPFLEIILALTCSSAARNGSNSQILLTKQHSDDLCLLFSIMYGTSFFDGAENPEENILPILIRILQYTGKKFNLRTSFNILKPYQ